MRDRKVRSIPFLLAAVLALAACQDRRPGERSGPLLAYIANAGSNHVQVVDLETKETLRRIYSGITPWRLVPAPDANTLWVQHWSSETTAVIELEGHEVEAVLPLRGPGTFDAEGDSFLSYSWPASGLTTYDTEDFATIETRTTEVSRAYDLALDESGENLFVVQYDPISRSRGQRYAYLVSLSLLADAPSPTSVRTGRSPVQVLTVPDHPFVLTADSESQALSLLNLNADVRTVRTCPGPQRMVLDDAASRMVVLCWDRDEGRHGHAISYSTDFSTRPWPTFTEDAAVTIDAGLVAGAFVPGGERIWVIDQPGRRLLELDAVSLAVRSEIATGAVPSDLALVKVEAAWRQRLTQKSDSRERLETAIARLQAAGAPFSGLRWKETLSWTERLPGEVSGDAGDDADASDDADDENPMADMETRSRQLLLAIAAPDRVRRHALPGEAPAGGDGEGASPDDMVSLSTEGWSLTVRRRDKRFWTAPRQELVSLLYALPNFPLDEAVRRLAGDVVDNPHLAGGLAVDVLTEIREDGREYLLIGALKAGEPVAQVWLDAETGRPTNLIEKFPTSPGRQHGGTSVGRFVETKFYDFTTHDGGVTLPSRLERALDGRWKQEVSLEDVEVDPEIEAADFDPARLAGFGAAAVANAATSNSDAGPGRDVAVLEHDYVSSPWVEHPPYNSSPPTSGPRLPSLAEWGVHRLPIPLALQVHNLEHGGVAVQYNCPRGCPEVVAEIERLTAPYSRVLVAPYPLMEATVALTAWGRIDTFDVEGTTMDELQKARIVAFLDRWEGHDHHGAKTAP